MKYPKSILGKLLAFTLLTTSLFLTVNAQAQQGVVEHLKSVLKESELDKYAISASIINGKMLIVGNVSSEQDKNYIIETAQNLPGVRELREEIIVDPNYGEPLLTDKEISNNINDALRDSSMEIPEVSVNDGVVNLKGDFETFREIDKISAIILSTSGVRDLRTDVTVKGNEYMKHQGLKRVETKVNDTDIDKKKSKKYKKNYKKKSDCKYKKKYKKKDRKRKCCSGK